MGNILDYVAWRGDLTFQADKFNYIDNLILSEICYIDFSKEVSSFKTMGGTSLEVAAKNILASKDKIVLGLIVPGAIINLLDAIKDEVRYKDIYLSNYINIIDENRALQFSGITMEISEKIIVVCFRGTDDTIIGWQENLDLVRKFPVPAQEEACKYLNAIASMYPNKKIIICGHSKGGNLAFYSAIYCDEEVKKRILNVYSNDGPGLIYDKIDKEKYKKIKKKLIQIVPQSSVIGLLFDNLAKKRIIVASSFKGINQHDGFSWLVSKNRFITKETLENNSIGLSKAISNMINSLSEDELKNLASNVYEYVLTLNDKTLLEAKKDPIAILANLRKISPMNRMIFLELMSNFVKYKQI